ncbi:hypothetical protein PHEL85_3116 [Polaribacter sp. Hel1_85]|nr:hypothetical protein PHEL85_3116 [Polaribacter sp. Hel1_85]
MNTVAEIEENDSTETNNSTFSPLIENQKFTYKYHGEEVLVIFSETQHIEYFNNKKNYIKSKISWVSKDECTMTIIESNLPNFPFKSGTKLSMHITKIKHNNVYYESTLGGRTWTGKMKKA